MTVNQTTSGNPTGQGQETASGRVALWDRRVSARIATPVKDYASIGSLVLEVTALQVQFKVKKTSAKQPNTAEITIVNLNAEHRAQVQTQGGKFILQAGYQTGVEQLFVGDIRDVSHVRDEAEWKTLIHSGDGERAYRWARVNEAYKAGTLVKDVVRDLAGKLGVNPGNLNAALGGITAQYTNGLSIQGSAQRELQRILETQGITWSIQDGALSVLKNDATTSIYIPDLGPDSGLIGSPEFGADEKTKGPKIKGKCLLQPKIHIGGRVHLNSERYKGDVKITEIEHSGDSMSGDWYTSFDGIPL